MNALDTKDSVRLTTGSDSISNCRNNARMCVSRATSTRCLSQRKSDSREFKRWLDSSLMSDPNG